MNGKNAHQASTNSSLETNVSENLKPLEKNAFIDITRIGH
jgi:hypothetical protein